MDNVFCTKETKERKTSKFNQNYFDNIDDENKAYWLGFLWSDGYLGYRVRENGREEYNLKLSLMENDYKHLEKFNQDLDGKYEVHFYKLSNSAFNSSTGREARLFITNRHFGKILKDKYGIIPHRESFEKISKNVPEHLVKHLIRGIVDADGTFGKYQTINGGHHVTKYYISICGATSVLQYIEDYFIKMNLINNTKRVHNKRHLEEDRDTGCRSLYISGKNQVEKVLSHLYCNSSVYLDRKYEKYLNTLED